MYIDENVQLREAWSSWLAGLGFQAFYTQTYADPCHYPRLAIERGWRVIRTLAVRYEVDVFAFLVAEEHRNGTYHCHGLVRTSPVGVLALKDSLRWIWLLGSEWGLCRFESIARVGGVTGYVAKYLTKRICDYDLFEVKAG